MDTLLVIFWFLALKTLTYWSLELFSPEDVIFSGVVACCSEVSILLIESVSISICYRIMFNAYYLFFKFEKLTLEDTNALWAMLTTNGGKCRQNLDKQCTHLITGNSRGVRHIFCICILYLLTVFVIKNCIIFILFRKGEIISSLLFNENMNLQVLM